MTACFAHCAGDSPDWPAAAVTAAPCAGVSPLICTLVTAIRMPPFEDDDTARIHPHFSNVKQFRRKSLDFAKIAAIMLDINYPQAGYRRRRWTRRPL